MPTPRKILTLTLYMLVTSTLTVILNLTMQKWQKYLVIGVLAFSTFHLIRDILQEFGIKIFLTEVLNKSDLSNVPKWYWTIPNSIVLETLAIIFAITALYKNSFKPFGILSILMLLVFVFAWLVYWFAF